MWRAPRRQHAARHVRPGACRRVRRRRAGAPRGSIRRRAHLGVPHLLQRAGPVGGDLGSDGERPWRCSSDSAPHGASRARRHADGARRGARGPHARARRRSDPRTAAGLAEPCRRTPLCCRIRARRVRRCRGKAAKVRARRAARRARGGDARRGVAVAAERGRLLAPRRRRRGRPRRWMSQFGRSTAAKADMMRNFARR